MPDYQARVLTPAERPLVTAMWEASARRLLVQHPGYAAHASLEGASGYLGVFQGERLVLAVPFAERRAKGLVNWQSPLFAPYSGPLLGAAHETLEGHVAESFWRDTLGAAGKAVPKSVDRAEILFPPGVSDVRGLAWQGWQARPHYNYVSEWWAAGEWRSSILAAARRQERKALSAGLSSRVAPAGHTDALRELWRRNAAHQRLEPELEEVIGRLGSWLESQNWGFAVDVVDATGAAHASALLGHDARRVYYLAGASDPAERGSGAPTLLHTAVLEEIDRRGLPKCYDWVGANTPGVAQFKRNFGPRLETLFAARFESRKARVVETAKGLVRR